MLNKETEFILKAVEEGKMIKAFNRNGIRSDMYFNQSTLAAPRRMTLRDRTGDRKIKGSLIQ